MKMLYVIDFNASQQHVVPLFERRSIGILYKDECGKMKIIKHFVDVALGVIAEYLNWSKSTKSYGKKVLSA